MASSFIGNFYYSTLSDFVAVTTLSVIFMWLCECKYIWMQICIYVVMFVLPRSHNQCQRYFNNEAFQLIQKDPDVVSQETSLFGAYGKFGWNLPQNYATLFFMICFKYFIMMIHKFTKLVFMGRQKTFLLGSGNLTRHAFDYSNLFQS